MEKTIDKDYELQERRFKSFETKCEKLYKESKSYLDTMRAMTAAQQRLAMTIDGFYEETSDLAFIGLKYKEATDAMLRKWSELDIDYRAAVTDPLAKFVAFFPDFNEAMKKRQKKLLDYDSERHTVKKLLEKPTDDPNKLPRAEAQANFARDVYETINNQLVDEIPKLIDLRVPYLNPTFEAYIKIEMEMAHEYYHLMAALEKLFPSLPGHTTPMQDGPTDLYQREVETVLQQMRELSICGML